MQSPAVAGSAPVSKPKLLDRARQHLRVRHYSIRTEQSYIDWIRRFILFHGKRHPESMGEEEVGGFLTHLAADKHVAASTQNQALSALLFLYQHVFDRKLDFMDNIERVKRPPKIPVVLTPEETRSVFAHLKGDYRLMAELLYGHVEASLTCRRQIRFCNVLRSCPAFG
jgi:site-specific recombinase XerD